MKHYAIQRKQTLWQILILTLTLFSNSSFSHDFWLEAHPFYTSPLQSVDISVHVGSEFAGDSLPNITSWYTDFSLYSANAKTHVKGELGRDPAGYFKPEHSGTYAIGYQTDFSYVEIDPQTFIKYLNQEGLDNAIELREKNDLADTPGRENYVRHAKMLVQSGDDFDVDNSMLNFGYELEIIPLSNPYRKKLNDRFSVKLLYQNRPIQNILLIAFSKARPKQMQSIRTNKNGEATITLDQPGPWLLKAVKILPVKDDRADWQSHWASLTFEVIH